MRFTANGAPRTSERNTDYPNPFSINSRMSTEKLDPARAATEEYARHRLHERLVESCDGYYEDVDTIDERIRPGALAVLFDRLDAAHLEIARLRELCGEAAAWTTRESRRRENPELEERLLAASRIDTLPLPAYLPKKSR